MHHESVPTSASNPVKGVAGEAAGDKAFRRAGFEMLPSKLPGNKGIDHVGVLRNSDGSVKRIYISESKYNAKGELKPGRTKHKGTQMDPKWVRETIDQMRDSKDPEVRKTAFLILKNKSKIVFKAHVLDPYGINRWTKPTKIVNRMHEPKIQPRAPPKPGK